MNEPLDDGGLRVLMHFDNETHEPPASRVDLVRVLTDGRRRRRWRAAAAGGATAAAVLVLAVVLPQTQTPAPTTPGAAAGESVMPPRPSAGGFDPVLMLKIQPGWLPPGVTADPHGVSMWAARQSERYTDRPGTTDLTVSLYAKDFAPSWLDPATKQDEPAVTLEPAPMLKGQRAQWYFTQADPQRSGLLWQWAPDAYATVEGIAPGSLAEDRALWWRVAEELATGARRLVPVPGYTTGTPPGMLLIGMDQVYAPEETVWRTILILNRRAYVPPPAGRVRPGIVVVMMPDSTVMPGTISSVGVEPAGPLGLGTLYVSGDRTKWTIDPVR